MKSIIIEDEFLIGTFIENNLKKRNIEVLDVIDNQQDAIKAIKEHEPDLVIIDKNLKHGGCGIEVFNTCKTQKAHFIFITGTNKDVIERIESLGCNVITKPFDSTEFLAALDKIQLELKLVV